MSRASATISTTRRDTEPRARPTDPKRAHWGPTLVGCALLMTVGLAVAAVSGTVLTWDGAAALLRVLHYGEPYTTHGRVMVGLLQLPVLALQRVTEDLGVLRLAYGVPYLLIPPLTLAGCWAVIRRRAPRLMIWPVLGIALATLPGQLFFISESVIALQLAWPLLLVVLLGISDVKRAIGAGLLCVVLFFLHPASATVFALAAVVAVGNALLRRAPAWPMVVLAGGLVALAAVRLLRLTDYERAELASATIALDFWSAVAGAPLLALGVGLVIGLAVLLTAHTSVVQRLPGGPFRLLLVVGLPIAVAAVLVPWAADPTAWQDALHFRHWAAFVSLPFFALAIADVWWPDGPLVTRPSADRLRAGIALGLSGVFALVIAVASLGWNGLLETHRQQVTALRSPCVSAEQLPTTRGTPLEHWAAGSLTVIEQSRAPLRLMLETPQDCRAFLAGGPPAVLGGGRTLRPGWFSFEAARWEPR